LANLNLSQTWATDIQTTFRFEIEIDGARDPQLGLTSTVVGYIQSSDLPTAPGDPIIWHLPGGMKNHQAGKRTVEPINMTFVVTTNKDDSIYRMLEKWAHATYDLDKGTNIGKARYCTDAISIILKGEDNAQKYKFRLKRAQVTRCNYGSVSSESNDLIKVSCTIVYDNYEVTQNGVVLKNA
jgi:hypothetical protein